MRIEGDAAGPQTMGVALSLRGVPTSTRLEMTGDVAERRRRFDEYIVPHLPFLARIARSMSHSPSQAEDLAQDTLLKAFRAIDGFDGRHPKAWLARIARNTAINRDERNREFLSDDGVVEPEGPEGHGPLDPQELVAARQVDAVLKVALDGLPWSFRLVVQLVDVEDMSYKEAAEALNIPVGTVMSRLHRARSRLRAALAGTHLDRGRPR